MSENRDIAVLAKKVYELSVLEVAAIDARKWEALLILNAVYSSATPEGIAKANADKDARWGDHIRKDGFLSAMHPRWHLRTDDGKPPAARFALDSAMSNPHRDLRSRLAVLQFIAPGDRPPLDDLVRAFVSEAFSGATGEARNRYVDAMRLISKTWSSEPWLTVLPHGKEPPPVMLLIDDQGVTHDGGIYDDPADDTTWDKVSWSNAIRTWNVDFLRDNSLAKLYTNVDAAVASSADAVETLAGGVNDAAKGVATLLKWAPYVLAGVGVVGATTVVLVAVKRSSPAE